MESMLSALCDTALLGRLGPLPTALEPFAKCIHTLLLGVVAAPRAAELGPAVHEEGTDLAPGKIASFHFLW